MTLDFKLLLRIVLVLLIISLLVWWLRQSVVMIKPGDDYVHAKCCASHGGCEDKEKCAAGTASCCSNEDCGECCGSNKTGIPVCRTDKGQDTAQKHEDMNKKNFLMPPSKAGF